MVTYCIPRLSFHLDPSRTKGNEALSETEKQLRKALSKISSKTILGKCIHIALAKKSNKGFRKIIPQLKDQLRDVPHILESVIGNEAIQLLKQL